MVIYTIRRRLAVKYTTNTTYIIGNSKSQQNNPITHVYGAFFIAFVVDNETEEIIDVECNSILPLTNEFIKTIFIGKSMRYEYDKLKTEIEKRYLGSSQKAILVAFNDAQKKYIDVKSGKSIQL
jgi:hypothetical protein